MANVTDEYSKSAISCRPSHQLPNDHADQRRTGDPDSFGHSTPSISRSARVGPSVLQPIFRRGYAVRSSQPTGNTATTDADCRTNSAQYGAMKHAHHRIFLVSCSCRCGSGAARAELTRLALSLGQPDRPAAGCGWRPHAAQVPRCYETHGTFRTMDALRTRFNAALRYRNFSCHHKQDDG